MRFATLFVAAILLSGCRSGRPNFPDMTGTIVYTAAGCAFYVTQGLGDLNGLARMPSADLPPCKKEPSA